MKIQSSLKRLAGNQRKAKSLSEKLPEQVNGFAGLMTWPQETSADAYGGESALSQGEASIQNPKATLLEYHPEDAELTNSYPSGEEASGWLSLLNDFRQQYSLHPLRWSPALAMAATLHSQDMATNQFLSHTGSGGTSLADRIEQTGYQEKTAMENLARGQSSFTQALAEWIDSPSHYQTLVSPDVVEVGLGYAYTDGDSFNHYWTLVAATRKRGFMEYPDDWRGNNSIPWEGDNLLEGEFETVGEVVQVKRNMERLAFRSYRPSDLSSGLPHEPLEYGVGAIMRVGCDTVFNACQLSALVIADNTYTEGAEVAFGFAIFRQVESELELVTTTNILGYRDGSEYQDFFSTSDLAPIYVRAGDFLMIFVHPESGEIALPGLSIEPTLLEGDSLPDGQPYHDWVLSSAWHSADNDFRPRLVAIAKVEHIGSESQHGIYRPDFEAPEPDTMPPVQVWYET